MNTSPEPAMQQGFLGLADAAFAAAPVLPFEQKVALLNGAPGLHLDAPARASTADAETLVCLGSRVTAGGEHLRVDLHGKAALLTLRLDDNELWAGAAFRGTPSEAPIALRPADAAPAAEDGDRMAEHFSLDLRARLGLELEAGRYRSWVLLFDTASNAVTTVVTAPAEGDPEVAALIERTKAGRTAPAVSPPVGSPLPNYQRVPESPLPPRRGVALALPRVTVIDDEARLVLNGSFRLPVLDGERSRSTPGATRPMAAAVVAVHLLLVGNRHSRPQRLRLDVPVAAIDDEGCAVGFFNLDLRRHLALQAQTYAVWSVAGGALEGPTMAALVEPGALGRPRR